MRLRFGSAPLAGAFLCLAASSSGAVELSIDINPADGVPFETSLDLIRQAGATTTSLTLFWDDLEPDGPGYAPAFDWPRIANSVYPGTGLSLTLTLSVIDTMADRRRGDLVGRAWDDPEGLRAAQALVSEILTRMPDVEIRAISIGNEIDGHLRTEEEIAAFAVFLRAMAEEVATIRPETPIGTKLTFAGLAERPDDWMPVVEASDALMVTYYPLNTDFSVKGTDVIAADLGRLQEIAQGLPIYVMEAGYPDRGCDAEATGQEAFVAELLSRDSLDLVSLTWLTDIPEGAVAGYADHYSIASECFARYLGSIGLRRLDGSAKPAFEWLTTR